VPPEPPPPDPEDQLASFVAEFTPELQELIRGCRARLAAQFPDAVQMVYDNYNFLVIGFGPDVVVSHAIFSLAAHARGVNLCFLQHGADLPDPTGVLRGAGKRVRNVVLTSPEDLSRADVVALMDASLTRAVIPMEASEKGELVIKSISEKQRPRQ
jgi:hypothetical protein